MPARNTTLEGIPVNVWTLVTDGSVTTALTCQNASYHRPMMLKATVANTAPTDNLGGIVYPPEDGILGRTLAEVWAGLPTAAYLWVRFAGDGGRVMISHA